MMKENNGRARRRRMLEQFLTRLGFFCLVATLLALVSVFWFPSRGGRTDSPESGSITASRADNNQRKKRIHDRKKRSSYNNTAAENGILKHADWHLIHIHIPKGSLSTSTYQGIKGKFCPLNLSLYKNDPSEVPFFKNLVSKSSRCERETYSVDLKSIVQKARESDNGIKSMTPAGFIFHESRCGSTLVSNVLSAVWPHRNRVYSESIPLIHALKACELNGSDGVCNQDALEELVRDVMYLLGRTTDPMETKMFFKIQSMGTISGLALLSRMYPAVPWIFMYRHPVQVMMSYWRDGDKSSSICTRGYQQVKRGLYQRGGDHDATLDLIERKLGQDKLVSLSKERYCATTLATFCEAALAEHSRTGSGHLINYDGLKDTLLNSVFPIIFGLEIGREERQKAEQLFGVYSKKRRRGTPSSQQWVEDSLEKEEAATEEVEAACREFLWEPYHALERLATRVNNS